MNTLKIKLALCVALSALQSNYRAIYDEAGNPKPGQKPQALPIDSSFYSMTNEQLRLVDRADCETDRSLRQILPYVICVDSDLKVFTYSRGGKGAEGRLHGNLSIGLGGHMDEQIPAATSFATWMSIEGNRELAEEAGLPATSLSFTHLLADTNDVGCVHCGVVAIRYVSAEEKAALSPEAGCIENGEWLSVHKLAEDALFQRLEGWSKLALPIVARYVEQIDANQRLARAQALIGRTESGVVLKNGPAPESEDHV
jgi:predicted NUDIX family phosphoesterase